MSWNRPPASACAPIRSSAHPRCTGLDFRAETGVRATAAGTVTIAGWNGGYGKMVRRPRQWLRDACAHLSAIDVELGQSVRIGQIVSRVSSPDVPPAHLRYETRVDGDAVVRRSFCAPACGWAVISSSDGDRSRARAARTSPHPRPVSGPPPNALRASSASMNWSRSPSSTPPVSSLYPSAQVLHHLVGLQHIRRIWCPSRYRSWRHCRRTPAPPFFSSIS